MARKQEEQEAVNVEPIDIKYDILGAQIRIKDETKYFDKSSGTWKPSKKNIQIKDSGNYINLSAIKLLGIVKFCNQPEVMAEIQKRADEEKALINQT